MAVKIRLRQQGRTNRRFYRLVATDTRFPRDGKYLDNLGWYNPHAEKEDQQLCIHIAKVKHWIEHGAQISPKAQTLIRKVDTSLIQEKHAKEHNKREKKAQLRRDRRKKAKQSAQPVLQKPPAAKKKPAPKRAGSEKTTKKKKESAS